MKLKALTALVILTLSSSVFANEKIENVKKQINDLFTKQTYIGIGLGYSSLEDSITKEEITDVPLAFIGGIKVNEYISIEGRYSIGLSVDYDKGNLDTTDSYNGNFSTWGVYAKPTYSLDKKTTVYALLGYGGLMLTDLVDGDAVESSFQWGVGVNYVIEDKTSLFVDYMKLYDDTGFDYRAQISNIEASQFTFGINYKF